jgi:hypothetical protein
MTVPYIFMLLAGLYVLAAIYAVFSIFYSGRRGRARFAAVVMALTSVSMIVLGELM